MFSTRSFSKRRPSPYLSYGSKQELKINAIELKKYQNGAMRILFKMEGRPGDGSFEPVDGAAGQVGTVIAKSYVDGDRDQRDFIRDVILKVAIAAGVRNEIDEIQSDNFEEYIEQLQPLLVGKFCRWFIAAKEYLSSDGQGRIKYNLKLPRYDFVESLETEKSRMKDFDKSNKYHFEAIKPTEKVPVEKNESDKLDNFEPEEKTDLPF